MMALAKPKTATASFRLDDLALSAIQEDAKKQNVSVNTLLNQLVLTYANFDRPMKRLAKTAEMIFTECSAIQRMNSTTRMVPRPLTMAPS